MGATERLPAMTEPTPIRADVLSIRLCPYCRGVEPARSDCVECEQAGLFDGESKPFHAPPPFDTWTPERLAALSAASARRGLDSPLNDKPRRISQSEIVERLLHALARGGQEHSSIELVRNAKGDVQIKVSVRTGEGDLETVEQARAKAEEQFDHLRSLYPMADAEKKP
jgi:hypothetical protein